jgi:hypothetical protein
VCRASSGLAGRAVMAARQLPVGQLPQVHWSGARLPVQLVRRGMPGNVSLLVSDHIVLPAPGIEPNLVIRDERPGLGQHPPSPVKPAELLRLQPQLCHISHFYLSGRSRLPRQRHALR